MKRYCEKLKYLLSASKSNEISLVIGNQSCDPDSVVGSLLASIIFTLQSPQNEDTSQLLSDLPSPSRASPSIPQLFLPIWPSHSWEKLLAKDDISHLNKTFSLELERFVEIQTSLISNWADFDFKDQVLYDHNSPEDILRGWLGNKLKPTVIVDHHALVPTAFQQSSPSTIHLEPSCSAV